MDQTVTTLIGLVAVFMLAVALTVLVAIGLLSLVFAPFDGEEPDSWTRDEDWP